MVVHQDDFSQQVGGCAVDGGVDGAQDDGQGLVDEDEHDAHLRQVEWIRDVPAPARQRKRQSK